MTHGEPQHRAVRVRAHPDIQPRLLPARPGREGLEQYRHGGGYRPGLRGDDLLVAIDEAGLRGRGGAAFPLAIKMRAVAGRGPVVVANGEEGEPTSMKDRWLLRTRPHLVIEGALLVAGAVGASDVYLYVSDPTAAHSARAAVDEYQDLALTIRVVEVAPGYVAGEETAVVNAINGGPAKPTDKPPRPYESGVAGHPTIVSNVETLANVPAIATGGAAAYRSVGAPTAPGTFLLTLGGAVAEPGLYEVPLGIPLREALEALGGAPRPPRGFLMGGYFGGLIGPRALDVALDYDAVAAAGNGLGCGAVTVLGPDDCPVGAAAAVMAYFDRENAGQCGSCFNGTAAMSAVLGALADGVAERGDVQRLDRWSRTLRGRGACATLDGAATLAASLLREFDADVREHLGGPCQRCDGHGEPPFAVRYDEPSLPEPAGGHR